MGDLILSMCSVCIGGSEKTSVTGAVHAGVDVYENLCSVRAVKCLG